jgi:hypothetical protein
MVSAVRSHLSTWPKNPASIMPIVPMIVRIVFIDPPSIDGDAPQPPFSRIDRSSQT